MAELGAPLNSAVGSGLDLDSLKAALSSSSTRRRTTELHALRERLAREELAPGVLIVLVQYIFATYAFYQDRPSREAVRRCIIALATQQSSEGILNPLVQSIKTEATKSSIAPTNALVLVEWCSLLLLQCSNSIALWRRWGIELLIADAQALELCSRPTSKQNVKRSAITVTRRALRALFGNDDFGEDAVREAVSVLSSKSGSSSVSAHAVLLGTIAGVCARMPTVYAALEKVENEYYSFYVREIIGSRTIPPEHIANGLSDFFSNYTSQAGLDQYLVPAVEKTLLRASEVVVNGVVSALIISLPSRLDLSEPLRTKLLKPFLSNVKSSSTTIRAGSLATFQVVATRCSNDELLDIIAAEIIEPLKASKISNAEQRALHAQMLEALPPSLLSTKRIPSGLISVVAKETSEAALSAESLALSKHLLYGVSKDVLPDPAVIESIAKGMSEKKVGVRKIWAMRAGDLLWAVKTQPVPQSFEAYGPSITAKLREAFGEVVSNPLPAAQSGLVTAGYIFTALFASGPLRDISAEVASARWSDDLTKHCLTVDPKPSFLLNHRIYTKLSTEEDLTWFLRALTATTLQLTRHDIAKSVQDSWSQAWLYLISAPGVKPSVRRETLNVLAKMFAGNAQEVGQIMISGMWYWARRVELDDRDSAAILSKAGNERLYIAVRSIAISAPQATALGGHIDDAVLWAHLADMIVLCQPKLLPRISWIQTCQRANVDPGELARSLPDRLLTNINCVIERGDWTPTWSRAKESAYDAAAELAFVAPDVITARLIEQLRADLDPASLENIGPTEAAIFRTPPGTAFVDVLAKRSKDSMPAKNAKDYDTLKWEQELREQLAQKQGLQKKLTVDEKAKVEAQLAKEADIRKHVSILNTRLLRGVGLIKSLALGPPTDAGTWIGPAIDLLLGVITAGAGLVVGNAALLSYLACAEQLTPRLGSMRPFVGIATLRAIGVSQLDSEMTDEPLNSLVTRVLYRLKFMGEQRPFDTVSFLYILPLMLELLQTGGLGKQNTEEDDEVVILALEFLAAHTDICSDTRVPRQKILSVLITTMQRYSQHYKLIKNCLHDLSRSIASSMTASELETLLKGAIVPEASVRSCILQVINTEVDLVDLDFSPEIWIACHDDVDENVELAQTIWEENALEVEADSPLQMLPFLESPDQQLRRAAARALSDAVKRYPESYKPVAQQLEASYRDHARVLEPQFDEFGMPKKLDVRDPWEARSGVALAFKELSRAFQNSELVPFARFLIDKGPLGDRSPVVRAQMVDAARTVVILRGKAEVEKLMATFEQTLESPDRSSESQDWINEAVVVLYGALAQHLKSGDERLQKVIQRLLETLKTPSESVQYAVAECLPPLVRSSQQSISEYIQQLLEQLSTSKSYASRRGAAYGLAGIVQGRGISALREFRIMSTLNRFIENKKDSNSRQGALFAYELLSLILGRIFEPYVIQIVPQLLAAFGDTNTEVREACLDTAKVCFASLSSFGVKQILPTLLEGLDDHQWRSKKGACDLLGAMAYLDPQQLALSLPDIIPPLTNVLNDSHKEVRASANRSLQRFGEVISNPEVKGLVGILLKALSDPTKYTDPALDSLIKVSFVHYLDAPSLALIVRILERGLGERSATKRKAAQIIGSLAHLTERKDLVVHLPILIAGLKLAIVDPVPTTRATASKALGSLVEKLGEDAFPDLIPSLMSTLKSETGAGDRLGSAQALSEVLAGLGTTRLEETLPSILQNVSSTKAYVREGFMSLFIYLPACFGNSFATYLSKIIPPILAGLADDVESIRETSLRAGRLLVKNFATRAIDLLLPELERGMADDSHRIRLSSVELVGDLLFNLTGISAKADEEDAEDGAGEAGQSLLEVLGEEKRNKVLSSLYICRCDTSGLVRSAAINVWKALVATPRTLKELIPTLTQSIIRRLASSNMEQKVIAGNALGELIRKAGDGVLASLLPTLEDGLQKSTDTDAKQGICIALRELISSATPESLEGYEKTLISVVRTALVDPDEDVREAAAEAFDSLQRMFGKRAVDQVLPHLLNLLRSESEAGDALSALLTLLTDNTRSNVILPNLIPTLLTSPITSFNAKALASLSQVAGSTMTRRLPDILNSLMNNIATCRDADLRNDLQTSFSTVLLSVDAYDGLNVAMSVMLALVKNDDHKKRAAADYQLARFFAETEVDFSRYYQDLIRVLLISFADVDSDVIKAAWTALTELMKRLKKEEMESLVISTRQTLRGVGVAGSNLPGFLLPKGINAILPIFLQGLVNGTQEQRTQSALGISDIIDRANADSLKPFVTQITGHLIRVVSERSVDVKAAILLTLNNLLERFPTFLKPFLPQLQRTFAKSLADTSSEVLRSRAAKALGTLITLTPRIDPLIAELVTGSKTPDPGVRNAMLKALHEVISRAGKTMSDPSRASVLALISSDVNEADDAMLTTNARLLGALVKSLPPDAASGLIKTRVVTTHFTQASVLALNSVLVESPESITKVAPFSEETSLVICKGITNKDISVSAGCILAAGKYLLTESSNKAPTILASLFETLSQAIQPGGPVNTRRLALVVIRTVSRLEKALVTPYLGTLVPPMFASVRDPVIPVKLSAEAAFLEVFSVVEEEGVVFEKYLSETTLPPTSKRALQDYFKRVAMRLANQARERKEAEGGQGGLGLSDDERDDEREIWGVGKLDLGDDHFGT